MVRLGMVILILGRCVVLLVAPAVRRPLLLPVDSWDKWEAEVDALAAVTSHIEVDGVVRMWVVMHSKRTCERADGN